MGKYDLLQGTLFIQLIHIGKFGEECELFLRGCHGSLVPYLGLKPGQKMNFTSIKRNNRDIFILFHNDESQGIEQHETKETLSENYRINCEICICSRLFPCETF